MLVPADLALVFPGQGSQAVGMARDLCDHSPAARGVFEEADKALGWPLSQRCFEGPDEQLRDTAVAQPALVTAAIATLVTIEERLAARNQTLQARFVAGHSVGQYAALVACGALDFTTAIRLVGARGALMKEAGERAPGGMAAVLGLDEEAVEAICREVAYAGVVSAANYNMPGQTVISGDLQALAAATSLAQQRGARKVVPLAVTVANHSPCMASAATLFAKLIDSLPLRDARVPLLANSSARPITAAADIRAELHVHMTSSVRWTASVTHMSAAGATTFWELGPGQVLSGLIKRTSAQATAVSIGNMAAVIAAIG